MNHGNLKIVLVLKLHNLDLIYICTSTKSAGIWETVT